MLKIKYIGIHDLEVPKKIELDSISKVKDVIHYISELNGIDFEEITVCVNNAKASFETELKEGDEILIFEILNGG